MYLHLPILYRALRATFSREHFHPAHAAWVMILTAAFFVLRTFVVASRALDHLLFPGFRRQAIHEPIYIIGNPRSGTTFLHRLMSLDQRFTTMRLFETIIPSVTLYRLLRVVRLADDYLGRPLQRLLASRSARAFGAWKGIHRTRFTEPEEDEQLFVYALVTPVLTLLFPFFDRLAAWNYADQLPERARRRLMSYYEGSLKRHLYAESSERRLLVKNTSISGRLRCTLDVFPDIKVIHLIRHPYDTVASLLSMYTATWQRLVPQVQGDAATARSLAFLFCDYYRYRLEVLRDLPDSQVIHVLYEDLVAEPADTVERVYDTLGLPLTADFRSRLQDEAGDSRSYRSRHEYSLQQFGLSERDIYDRLKDIFEEYGFSIVRSPGPSALETYAH